jgi:hypothetical protein
MMNQGTVGALGGVYLFIVLFLVILAILWFFLPFAIFGTKAKLDLLIQEMKRTNAKLEQLQEQIGGPANPISHTREVAPSEMEQGEAMKKYGISRDGEKFGFKGHRYDKAEDAIAFARKQEQDGYLY